MIIYIFCDILFLHEGVFLIQKFRGVEMVKSKKKEVKKESFFKQVKKELKKVSWPSKKNMIKFSVTTIWFILLFSIFFFGLDSIFAFVKGLMN